MKNSTKTLYDKASRCESLEEYKELFKSLESQKENWSKKINSILVENDYSSKAKVWCEKHKADGVLIFQKEILKMFSIC